MHIPWLTDFVIFAQQGGEEVTEKVGEQNGQGGGFGDFFIPMIGIFLIFWFLIIRPQSKQQKERNLKIKSARKGDTVVTIGGVYGKIVKESELDVVLEVDKQSKARITFLRTAIQDVIDLSGGKETAGSKDESAEKDESDAEPPPIQGS